MITKELNLDLERSGIQDTVRGFYTGENGEKRIRFRLYVTDYNYSVPNDYTAALYAVKPDGTRIATQCDVYCGDVYYSPTEQTTAVEGDILCQLEIISGDGRVMYTPQFMMSVERSMQSQVISNNELSMLDQLLVDRHRHDNKAFLDGLNESSLHEHGNKEFLDGLSESSFHNHENKALLDNIGEHIEYLRETAHTHDNKGFLDGLNESSLHEHGNKEFLDGLSESSFHDHENKELLDNIEESLDYLSETAHTHVNKDVLDVLTYADMFHTNRQSLDKLTVTDGELFIDGKRFGGVVVWHIVDDPVNVPSMADGTLLFITPGENGDMDYPPYYVNVLGTPVKKIAPWKPGQLWVCRGGVWFLIATANRTEYKPEEVITETVLPDGEVAAISTLTEADVSASAPTEEEVYDADPCENVDKSGGIVEAVKTLQTEAHTHSNLEALERVEVTDDVVLLPFGKPLNLYLRDDFQHLQYPQIDDVTDVGISVQSTDGREILLGVNAHLVEVIYFDGEYRHISNDGETWIGGTIHPNEEPINDFSIKSIGYWLGIGSGYVYFDSEESINGDNYAKIIYRLFSQAFNTSPENMGSIKLIENVFEGNYANGLKWGRNYYITVNDSTYALNIDWTCPIPNDDLGLRHEAYCVVYLNLEQDCDIAHEAQYLVNGESPNTKAGLHKWIFNYLSDGTVSLGAIDLEAI